MISVAFAHKLGMTHIYDEKNRHIPVTILKLPAQVVTALVNSESKPQTTVQIGATGRKKVNKPQLEELKKNGIDLPLAHRKQVTVSSEEEIAVGSAITVEAFQPGDKVMVTGKGKGKGFSGGIKRYGWSRGPMSHGSKHHRAPGSIGSGYPQRVVPGKKLPGHMGFITVTSKSHVVMAINPVDSTLAISGPVPGANKSRLLIQKIG